MSKFIKTEDGALVLSSEIVKVQPDKIDNCTIMTKSDQVYSVSLSANELAQETTCDTICGIPAEPGYFVVEAFSNGKVDDDWKAWFVPVVAWFPIQNEDDSADVYTSRPIVAGQRKYGGVWALVWPDGKITNTCARSFKSIEEWLDYAKEFDESDD